MSVCVIVSAVKDAKICESVMFWYTIHTMIRITIKISIGLNVLRLPLWHSLTFDFFFKGDGNPDDTYVLYERS